MLRLHLSSRHLITTGKKATLARRLHEALHLTVPATTANSASSITVPPPATTQTSINSSTPTTVTVMSTTNSSTIAGLPPALQQQFSTLMQQYISNAALQPNLPPASDCNNSSVPTSMLPQSVNVAALTFTQASTNYTSAATVPSRRSSSHHVSTASDGYICYAVATAKPSAHSSPAATSSLYTTVNITNHYFTAAATIYSCYFTVTATIISRYFTATATGSRCFTATAVSSLNFTTTANASRLYCIATVAISSLHLTANICPATPTNCTR